MNNKNIPGDFRPFAEKMRAEGVPDIVIENFKQYYQQLLQGQTGLIPESSIQPVNELPNAEELSPDHAGIGEKTLSHTVLLKLNGGLGTSMGLEQAKSLITAREGLTFLDIIAEHAVQSGAHLLLMNSFRTREDSLNLLQNYPSLQVSELALDFLQHKVPKVSQHDLTPVTVATDPELEWCPPGHGDIYLALVTSGMLDALLQAGYQYALISNSDNLGAVLDTSLLGYLVKEQLPFLMEVADRTAMDKKGGHLASSGTGQLLLREAAQCPEPDRADFENISRHKYFNTNNIWINLQVLRTTLEQNSNILNLPLIRNAKPADPRTPDSTPVYQLETAMGAAISVFAGAQAIRVPRSRFAPVKTTNELLLVRSDIYELSADYTLNCKLPFTQMPVIKLDKRYYQTIDDFESRFPAGAPSLTACQHLEINGDIVFGKDITIEGSVKLNNHTGKTITVADNTHIAKDITWD